MSCWRRTCQARFRRALFWTGTKGVLTSRFSLFQVGHQGCFSDVVRQLDHPGHIFGGPWFVDVFFLSSACKVSVFLSRCQFF